MSYGLAQTIPVAQTGSDVRAAFIRRTYIHLGLAVASFAALEAVLLQSAIAPAMMRFVSGGQFRWLMILGAFILAGWLARSLAANVTSPAMQYLGLGCYVVAEAIIFVPILYIAVFYSSANVLPTAALLTGALFLGLTTVAFTTRTDFSFLRGILTIGGFVAIGLIIGGAIFGFNLGLVFSTFMVVLASGAILYDTSKIIHHYSERQHVAAALELFASVALLFWYVLRIVMSLSRD